MACHQMEERMAGTEWDPWSPKLIPREPSSKQYNEFCNHKRVKILCVHTQCRMCPQNHSYLFEDGAT